MVTLVEVAKAAGVSVSTASRALSGSTHPLKEETRSRILSLANEMGYTPNLVARSLQSQKTYTVGVVADRITTPFAGLTIQGLQDSLRRLGYSISVVNSNRDFDAAAEAVQAFQSRRVDGIIVINAWLHKYNNALSDLVRTKPHIFVNRIFDQIEHNCVEPDDRVGGQLATRHLINLGHRRIGYINGLANWKEAQNRQAGYQDELHGYGLAVDPNLIKQGDWSVDSGFQATAELMTLAEPPTAIFAANDLLAMGAIYAVQAKGLSVPGDVAVVGYDDRDFAGWIRPALTTVRLPSYEMGQTAAQLLLKQLSGEELHDAVKIPGELIIRQSCGATTS